MRWLYYLYIGTPRVNTDSSGNVVARHDYLPFGEEISGLGSRANHAEYRTDSIRQKYTGYEHDWENGLDYAQARYYASQSGRFTSVDPLMASANISSPQSFNRYSYALNNPYKYVDPSGMEASGLDDETDKAFAALDAWADSGFALWQQEQDAAKQEAERKKKQQQGHPEHASLPHVTGMNETESNHASSSSPPEHTDSEEGPEGHGQDNPLAFFKKAELLNKDEEVVRAADFGADEIFSIATLRLKDTDIPAPCKGDVFRIRAFFHFNYDVVSGGWNKQTPGTNWAGSSVSLGVDNMFRSPTQSEAPTLKNMVEFVEDSPRDGHVDVWLKLTNPEGRRSSFTIRLNPALRSSYVSGDFPAAQGIVRIICPQDDPRRH